MTADIVNLKRVRKAKARLAKVEAAHVSRAAFGRTKAEREATEAEAARANQLLDGAKLPTCPLPLVGRVRVGVPTHPLSLGTPTPALPTRGRGKCSSFPSTAEHDGDDDLDPGNVS